MSLAQLSLLEQGLFVFSAILLFTSFALLAQRRLLAQVHVFAWQGAVLATVTAFAAAAGDAPHLYLSALLTLALKALLIPAMLRRLIRRLDLERHVDLLQHGAPVLMIGAALVLFSYWISLPIERLDIQVTRNVLSLSLAVVLLGLLVMVARTHAITQVVGFMSIENGLFLAAVSATQGMPMIVELGIAFDVLVAAILFGVFFLQISESIDSLDVDRLNRLRAEEPAPAAMVEES